MQYDSIEEEIANEFLEYDSYDGRGGQNVSAVFQSFGKDNSLGVGFNRGFQVEGYIPMGLEKYEILENFAKELIATGNIDYARKSSAVGYYKTLARGREISEGYAKRLLGVGYYTAHKYIDLLNSEAIKRGLPPVFVKKNGNLNRDKAKLCAKQVSMIKYLVTKHSSYKVANIYRVSQATIIQIKNGLTWRDVSPSIPCKEHKRLTTLEKEKQGIEW